ncbi:unnamed protein product, partial [Phaeothamnion confervicola]
MEAEDALSAIVPLTTAPAPRLAAAGAAALWLEWVAPARDARGRDNGGLAQLEYLLFMRGGFRQWTAGDRVRVSRLPPKTSMAGRKAAPFSGSVPCFGSYRLSTATAAALPRALPPATITRVHGAGATYDVRYDDGARERAVPRGRIQFLEVPPWTLVYRGADRRYVVEGVVPPR